METKMTAVNRYDYLKYQTTQVFYNFLLEESFHEDCQKVLDLPEKEQIEGWQWLVQKYPRLLKAMIDHYIIAFRKGSLGLLHNDPKFMKEWNKNRLQEEIDEIEELLEKWPIEQLERFLLHCKQHASIESE